jgi:hypothetical protein
MLLDDPTVDAMLKAHSINLVSDLLALKKSHVAASWVTEYREGIRLVTHGAFGTFPLVLPFLSQVCQISGKKRAQIGGLIPDLLKLLVHPEFSDLSVKLDFIVDISEMVRWGALEKVPEPLRIAAIGLFDSKTTTTAVRVCGVLLNFIPFMTVEQLRKTFDGLLPHVQKGTANVTVFNFVVKCLRKIIRLTRIQTSDSATIFVMMMKEGSVPGWPKQATPTSSSEMTKFVRDYIPRYPENVQFILVQMYGQWSSSNLVPQPNARWLILPLTTAVRMSQLEDSTIADIFIVALQYFARCDPSQAPDCLTAIATIECMSVCLAKKFGECWKRPSKQVAQRSAVEDAVDRCCSWIDAADLAKQDTQPMQLLLEPIPNMIAFVLGVCRERPIRPSERIVEKMFELMPFPVEVACQKQILDLALELMLLNAVFRTLEGVKVRGCAVFARLLLLQDEQRAAFRFEGTWRNMDKFLKKSLTKDANCQETFERLLEIMEGVEREKMEELLARE